MHPFETSEAAIHPMNDKHDVQRSLGGLLHHQVASVVRDGIAKGRFAVGHMLPPEMELCEQFSVSRITIRRAMQTLLEEGLIERRRGLGTYVRAALPITTMDLRSALPNHMASTADVAAQTEAIVTAFGFGPPPQEVQAALRLSTATQVLRVERMRHSGQLPVVQTTVYLPEKIGKRFSRSDFASTSLHGLMAREKQAYGRVELHCTAMLADHVVAKAFGILIGAPLIGLKRLAFNKQGKPIEYLVGLAPPDRYDVKVSYEGTGELAL